MSDVKLTFCIFSYNRGRFLRNCVDSIRACAPNGTTISIFDDDSDDPETLQYLAEAESHCEILKPQDKGTIKHGGLYLNMQLALEHYADAQLICFLQDDTQVVRPISEEEVNGWHALFSKDSNVGFVHPCFIRGVDQKKRPVFPLRGPISRTYFRRDMGQSAGIYYSDLFITLPQRLLSNRWNFAQSEPANDLQAREYFTQMVYLEDPFAMWLPEVPAYRGKHKTLALKIAEKKKRAGFYPFQLWSQGEAQEFCDRLPEGVPIAEVFLDCSTETPPKPWTYNALSGMRLLKALNNLEVALRKLWT